MAVVTVAQQKGGAGKTALAAHLGAYFAETRSVALIDIDPQRSLARWHGLRMARARPANPITLAEIAGWRLPAEVAGLARRHAMVLVDTPPHTDTEARLAIRAADLVLVPIQPAPPDLWAAEATLALAAAERRPVRLVFNRAPAASRLRSLLEAEIAERGLALLAAALGNRMGFAGAFAAGLGVSEASPRSRAADEIRSLAAEIEGVLG